MLRGGDNGFVCTEDASEEIYCLPKEIKERMELKTEIEIEKTFEEWIEGEPVEMFNIRSEMLNISEVEDKKNTRSSSLTGCSLRNISN